jgi:sulfite exporter TauE/SafE/copper chaperone CopZ
MSNLTTKTLRVDGMTCTSCEDRIERKLKSTQGITDVRASFADGSVRVTCDTDVIGFDAAAKIIEDLDYRVMGENEPARAARVDILKVIWVAVALYELYAILDRFGLLDIFYAFPEAKAGMGWGMLFTIGLLTSMHCIAMCGGINLSQSVSKSKSQPLSSNPSSLPRAMAERVYGGRFAALRAGFLYNMGRVASYTIIGGLVGALGSVVSVSGSARGWVQLVAGAFMVIMGLNMLNVFPWLRRLNPHMPKVFAAKIHAGGNRTPLYVGLLNGLMPCGPLQAMQLYALSTGSFVRGALAMLFFSLGTAPLMFGLSALSGLLSKKFAHGMMTVGATLVVIMGIAMFGNGMNLSGIYAPSVFAPGGAGQGVAARIEGDVQVVRTELASGRYAPISVRVGVPVQWTIHAEPGTLNGCNNRIIIPEYGRMQKKLEPGDNLVEFTPTRSGTFVYSCWMGMIRSRITVLDAEGNGGEAGDEVLTAELPADLFSDIASDEPFDIFEVIDNSDINKSDTSGDVALGPLQSQSRRCSCCH